MKKNMKKNIKKNAGFTLIELVMVMVILSVISVIAAKILSTGIQGFLAGKNILDADWQGRVAMERMSRDIRAVRSPSDITTASASNFVFTDSTGTSINYSLSGSSLLRNSQTLADGVNSLTFTYLDGNGSVTASTTAIRYITITLNITLNETNFSLTTSIYPRNLP
jgi:prepilin-type N-terminal cleavage/methylation domain-containing protein